LDRAVGVDDERPLPVDTRGGDLHRASEFPGDAGDDLRDAGPDLRRGLGRDRLRTSADRHVAGSVAAGGHGDPREHRNLVMLHGCPTSSLWTVASSAFPGWSERRFTSLHLTRSFQQICITLYVELSPAQKNFRIL